MRDLHLTGSCPHARQPSPCIYLHPQPLPFPGGKQRKRITPAPARHAHSHLAQLVQQHLPVKLGGIRGVRRGHSGAH